MDVIIKYTNGDTSYFSDVILFDKVTLKTEDAESDYYYITVTAHIYIIKCSSVESYDYYYWEGDLRHDYVQ